MPKGKNKGGRRQKRGDAPPVGAAAENWNESGESGDDESVGSSRSDVPSLVAEGEEELDEIGTQENFEDKLKDYIDGLTQKSAKGRTDCMKSLIAAFRKKYLFDFIADRKLTIMDGLERCLKKGAGEEQSAAAKCVACLLVQLGASEDAENLFKDVRSLLTTLLLDQSKAPKARGACAEALAVGSFLASEELADVLVTMKSLERVFKDSYLKGDGNARAHTPEVASLHNDTISSWTLLLSIAPPATVQSFLESHLSKLPELLTSADVDLRITAGESIALLYELAREEDEDFRGKNVSKLIETLKQLATDSNKYRAKKDRRQQRANFRDILRTVEEGEGPNQTVKFGRECLYLDTWSRKRQYDVLCNILASGMNVHLQENDVVRDIFGLGAPIPDAALPTAKGSKVERHLMNQAAFKARTKARAKTRDKRTASAFA